jgi:hypothetical protein
MKRLLFLACTVLALATGARADYIVTQTVENAGQSQKITLKLKDGKCRVDATEQSSAIMDANTGETVVLIHPQKAFIRISKEQMVAQAKAMKDMLGNRADDPMTVELQPTGKKETINGYETEEYTYDLNGIHNTVAVDKGFKNYQSLVTALYNVQSGPGLEAFRPLALPPDKFPGMPIRTTVEVMGQKVVTTLDSAQETNLSDADFAIPDGYKELQMNAAPSATPLPSAQLSPTPAK